MFSSNTSQVSNNAVYVEDVFSTWLYTGNGSTQTITNGIDLAGKGGLVWLKGRSLGYNNGLFDTVRGADFLLCSNNTDPSTSVSGIPANAWITGFNSNGFGLGSNGSANSNTQTYVSWTFREQPKFFDVVTYTGNYTARTIAHSLGSVPGCIIVKKTSSADDWRVYHRSLATNQYMTLETTAAVGTSATMWNNTAPTSTVFSIGAEGSVNDPGETFVAYLFAHNAGGFGNTGTDNVISCGSFTTDGSGNATVNLGYEPQWILVKKITAGDEANSGHWWMQDNMRGYPARPGDSPYLQANTSAAEANNGAVLTYPTSTGFVFNQNYAGFQSANFIYVAIRRGPMKTPTTGTSVFVPTATSGSTGTAITTNFPVDMQLYKTRLSVDYWFDVDRLRGVNTTTTANLTAWLDTTSTSAEATASNVSRNWNNTGVQVPGVVGGASNIFYSFRRAPGFFDEVCYTGNGVAGRTVNHNLGVAPEMMIVKARDYSGGRPWPVYHTGMGNTKFMYLNTSDTQSTNTWWNDTTPTSTVFTVGSNSVVNFSGTNYVAYLFASCPGVSKVGSYTGTGSDITINCGFTGGARFVLLKCASNSFNSGQWYVWDSARGITSGNDPYLLLNDSSAEVTGTNYVDADSSGFIVKGGSPAGINESGGTYIYLAIA